MRRVLVFAIPFVTSLVLALLLGLLTDAIRVDGSLSLVVALAACAVAAAVVSMSTAGLSGVVLGTIGGASVIPIVLAIKACDGRPPLFSVTVVRPSSPRTS